MTRHHEVPSPFSPASDRPEHSPGERPGSPRISARAYRTMRAVEDDHWWFDGMEAITARLLASTGLFPTGGQAAADAPGGGATGRRCLDAGCGTGRNLRFLARAAGGEVWGVDFSSLALACCRERGFARLARASVNALPFADGTFDLVTSLDVLTAGGVDDRAALAEFARVLRPGGWALVRVAAYDSLRGRHDLEWDITHRYRRGELRAKLAAAGLEVRRASYANLALFPVVVAKRLAEHFFPPKEGASDLQLGAGRSLGGRLLGALLAGEARWVASGCGLPAGSSLFALARKP